jgi:hypothetical protein
MKQEQEVSRPVTMEELGAFVSRILKAPPMPRTNGKKTGTKKKAKKS